MWREDIERFAFLYLCGARDKKLLSGKEEMTFSDFDRLIYITGFLGLVHYNLKMWNQYSNQFQSQLAGLERSYEKRSGPLDPAEYGDDISKREQWITDFCNDAPGQETQEYLRGIVGQEGERQ